MAGSPLTDAEAERIRQLKSGGIVAPCDSFGDVRRVRVLCRCRGRRAGTGVLSRPAVWSGRDEDCGLRRALAG